METEQRVRSLRVLDLVTPRPHALRALIALLLLAAGLVPLFQANLLAPGDAYFFSNWDKESQALVLAEIERTEAGQGLSRFGLQNSQPDVLAPYSTFDAMKDGTLPTGVTYVAYPSSLGMQGRLFTAAYSLGCNTITCLNTVESTLFAVVFVAFLALLALISRKSLSIVVLVSGLLSPWVTSAAHNLYWVPWTWLLPSIAAALAVLARSRRGRTAALVLVGVATAVKASTGYEFLTTTTLLAASMAPIAQVLGRRRPWRSVIEQSVQVLISSVAGFLVVLVVHAVVTGSGDVVSGFQSILHDALKRTYGPASLGGDGITTQSLQVSPLQVLALYSLDWRSSLFSIGVGGPFTVLALGPGAFWVLVICACAIPIADYMRDRVVWRRDVVLILSSAAPAVSWFVIGKSHSWTATSVNFVLWYWIFVPVLIWIVGARLGRTVAGRRVRELRRTMQGASPALPQEDAL